MAYVDVYIKAAGLYTQADVARACGVAHTNVQNWLNWGLIPDPTEQHGKGRRRYWNEQQFNDIVKAMKKDKVTE